MSFYKQLFFVALFTLLALAFQQVNFSKLVGSESQAFTFFQFFGPTASAFLGLAPGMAAILLAQLANNVIFAKPLDFVGLWRLLPMLFAAYYFGMGKREVRVLVPLVCMALFVMHPVGAQAWVYSLYWLIPAACVFFSDKLILRSLGATFTAHAIGSTVWLYTVPMPASAWLALIPVVAFERGLFTLGIASFHVAFNTLLSAVEARLPAGVLKLEKQYAVKRLFAFR